MKGAIALAAITRNGMRLDRQRLEQASAKLREQVFETAAELEAVAEQPVLRRYKQARYITPENRGYKLSGSGTPCLNEEAVRALFQKVADEHGLKPPRSETDEKLSLTKHFWTDHRELSPVVDGFLELKARGKLYGFLAREGQCLIP